MTNDGTNHGDGRFRLLVESISDYAVYMLDLKGEILSWNRGGERIKGYAADEVIGRHFSLFYTPEDRRTGVPSRLLETVRREGRTEAEGWRLRKGGARFWASVVVDPIHDAQGRHIGYAKITQDISDRRAAEEALAQSERQFRMLVAGVSDYALFMIDPSGVITNWNSGAQKIKGYTAEEIVGRHISAFYTAGDRAAGAPNEALRIAAEHGRHETEAWRVRKDGSLFWANVVLDAIHDDTGELVGFAKITRDISERRAAQLELQRAQEHLAQAQKMEALGQLTGGVAHDFNNLLMVVSGHAQLLRRRIDDPRALAAIDAIETATRRGQDLTRHLLAFARRQRLNPVTVALSERMASINDLLKASLGAGVRLTIDLPDDLWPVQIDPSELELALLNMTVNARDAMGGEGSVRITACNTTAPDDDQPDGPHRDFVALTVRDTGAGIPPDVLPRVFEPFFTTKEVNRGTGLGLSQVYGFTQQSGGRVRVESELGVGTAITLLLPRTQARPVARTPSMAMPGAPGEASILMVEDNPEVAEVACGLLEQLGAQVRVATSAAEALTVLEDQTFDLLFSDIVMAGDMDGLGLARRLRSTHPQLPILLATGYSEAAERIGDEFPILPKPYQLADLSKAIGTLLAERPRDSDGKLVMLEAERRARRERSA